MVWREREADFSEILDSTPVPLRPLLADLFAANTFWELAVKNATAQPDEETGSWRVTLDVQARKVVVDSAGAETEVAMNDLVEVGVFAATEDGRRGEPLYLQKHRVRSGKQSLTMVVPGKPAQAGIDPRSLLIDVEARDNSGEIKLPAP